MAKFPPLHVSLAAVLILSDGVIITPSHASIKVESAFERPCFKVDHLAVPVDPAWLWSYDTLYYNFGSRLDIYRMAEALTGEDFYKVSENKLYYEACFHANLHRHNLTYVLSGFWGHRLSMPMTNLSPDGTQFTMPYDTYGSPNGVSETCWSTLTDNKTFSFYACCFADNQMTFHVATPLTKVPREVAAQIHAHATSLGFNVDYFAHVRHELCNYTTTKSGHIALTYEPQDRLWDYEAKLKNWEEKDEL